VRGRRGPLSGLPQQPGHRRPNGMQAGPAQAEFVGRTELLRPAELLGRVEWRQRVGLLEPADFGLSAEPRDRAELLQPTGLPPGSGFLEPWRTNAC
jgi:hypothetical protein